MNLAWLVLQIAVPVAFWSAYHYYKDRHLPEPPANLVICFVLGIAAAGISRLLYEGLGQVGLRYDASALAGQPGALMAYAVLAIGPIEELAKLLPFLLVVLRFRAFDEPLDGIIYASFIALGYAAVENLLYLPYLSNMEAIARGFASPLVHAMFASVWGFYVGRSFLARGTWRSLALLSVAVAAALHGLYDFLAMSEPGYALPMSALLMLAIWVWRMLLIRGLHNLSGFEAHCEICETITGVVPRDGASSSHAATNGPGTERRESF